MGIIKERGHRWVDLTGRKFGRLVAIEIVGKQNRQMVWRCQCECGVEACVRGTHLTSGATQSCGCVRREVSRKKKGPRHDISGKTFGLWSVLRFDATRSGSAYFICRCDCGKELSVRGTALKSGATRSCGCAAAIEIAEKRKTHGCYGTPEYRAWQGMIRRCCNPNHRDFQRWGARGIRICDEWRHSFEAFLSHVGLKPSPKHTLDRINNDGPYEPGNVRWATPAEQSRNKSDNVYVTAFGKTQVLIDWARETGIGRQTIKRRLTMGWRPEDAVSVPAGGCR